MIKQEEVFKIGRFAKPHGVKGELALVSKSLLFEEAEDPYIVCDIDGILVPFFIESFRYKSDSVVLLKLEYVDNEESAREFVNLDVYYPLEEVEPDQISGTGMEWEHFIGYSVSAKEHGLLGRVVEVDESTINVILHIDYNGGVLLFPAADELISEVNHPNKQLTVLVPEGLLDL
ncbi:ribosome maturation factor RimM [Parabacteroides sp. OttesenSCG-928-N08]|nr:ribosome maturation factor RimM [Parabacteroides sp. OttesenSCG-928-N08]